MSARRHSFLDVGGRAHPAHRNQPQFRSALTDNTIEHRDLRLASVANARPADSTAQSRKMWLSVLADDLRRDAVDGAQCRGMAIDSFDKGSRLVAIVEQTDLQDQR